MYFRFSTHFYVLGGYLSYSCTLDLVHIPMCSVILVYFRTHSYVLGGPVILVYFRFSTHSYVLGGYLSYSCTLDLVHIPMCSAGYLSYSCTLDLVHILCARWLPVILVYFRFSTHSYVHEYDMSYRGIYHFIHICLGGYLSYSCTLDLVHIECVLCARWIPVILVYFRYTFVQVPVIL